MLLKKINLEDQLKKEKKKKSHHPKVIDDFYKILEERDQENERISHNATTSTPLHKNNFKIDLLERDHIYHISHIKNICIDYRLRFLDSKYFKAKLPQEAITKIKKLEDLHAIEIKNFKIIAPSKLFKLEDEDDPLLFAAMGNDYYYLIHKWGTDLHPLRKTLMLPFKSMVNLLIFILVLSYLGTFLIPSGLFSKSSATAEIWILGFFIFKIIAAIALYYGIAMRKNFNPNIWNSKFL